MALDCWDCRKLGLVSCETGVEGMSKNVQKPGVKLRGVEDTDERVVLDRKKYVKEYVERGLSLRKILEVFSPSLKDEISDYYYQEGGR